MAKYEIMLIVSGSLEEKKAKDVANEISSSIKSCKPKVEEYGLKELAYKIGKDTHGYYFQYNFECEDPNAINEFGRLARINKNALRHLIINLEKDYGYRATINPKKIKSNQIKAEIHARRKAEYEKNKEARLAAKNGDENLEHIEKHEESKIKPKKETKVKKVKEDVEQKQLNKEADTKVVDSPKKKSTATKKTTSSTSKTKSTTTKEETTAKKTTSKKATSKTTKK